MFSVMLYPELAVLYNTGVANFCFEQTLRTPINI